MASPQENNESFEQLSKRLFIQAIQTKNPDSYMAAMREEATQNPAVAKKLYDFLSNPKMTAMIGLIPGKTVETEAKNYLKNALHQGDEWGYNTSNDKNFKAYELILSTALDYKGLNKSKEIFRNHVLQLNDLKHPLPYINFLTLIFSGEETKFKENESVTKIHEYMKHRLINKINHFIDNDIVIDKAWGYVFYDKFKAEPSPERQKLYLKMSCALGNFSALTELAETIEKQYDKNLESFRYIERAAKCGSDSSRVYVATIYYAGSSAIKMDRKKAHDLFLESYEFIKANEEAYKYIYDDIAELYENGFEGQPPCLNKAVYWYKKSAKAGSVEAMRLLSLLYMGHYKNVKPDNTLAYEWLFKAASSGHTEAMLDLCHFLLGADDFSQNIDQAFFWLEKSSALGNKKAKQYIEFLIDYAPALPNQTVHKIQSLMEKDNNHLPDETIKECLEQLDQSDCLKKAKTNIHSQDSATQEYNSHVSENNDSSNGQSSTSTLIQSDDADSKDNYDGNSEPSSCDASSDSSEFDSQSSDEELAVYEEEDTFDLGNQMYDGRQIHEAFQAQKLQKLQEAIHRLMYQDDKPLSSNGKKIIEIIKNSPQKLDIPQIISLFKDPFFKNQACSGKTKSGYSFVIHKKDTNEHMTFGTHKKHTKKYKGLDINFIAELKKAIALFGL